MKIEDIDKMDWKKMNGIIPAVVQDKDTLQVLMLGYMNKESLKTTFETGKVCFYSRTKERLWTKGESSGNYLNLFEIKYDCDQDALLVKALPRGPTCHKGSVSCFESEEASGVGFLAKLERIISDRKRDMPKDSYTSELFSEGLDRIAQKLGEEAVETVIASKNPEKEPFTNECADLLYHLLVLLREKETSVSDVIESLRNRHK